MVINMEVLTKNAQETQKLGQELANNLSFGKLRSRRHARVVCLYGELGSGKTTFTQGVAAGLGIKQRITSPTFVYIRNYTLYPSPYTLYHIDLYRIESLNDAKALGIEEILQNKNNIVLIEWPEKIKDILPNKRTEIYFEYLSENERKLTIKEYQ
ncbi:MAG: tRNA (adenosine(37)-N6)-threonylcarbamoyltransferase complex ATPase subunit type 1 TsaE [Candidatus Gottesmanbacteria bacterium]